MMQNNNKVCKLSAKGHMLDCQWEGVEWYKTKWWYWCGIKMLQNDIVMQLFL